jgi:protein CpxP
MFPGYPFTTRKLQMKLRLITLTAACAAMLATISIGNAQEPAQKDAGGNRHRHHNWGNSLEHMTKTLDLTPDQQAKIGPILEQAKPQMKAAHQESKEKMKTVRDNIRSQIRPILTPVQQQKWDAIQKAREDMRKAREALRAAEQQ